jgi:hypothetical protein
VAVYSLYFEQIFEGEKKETKEGNKKKEKGKDKECLDKMYIGSVGF